MTYSKAVEIYEEIIARLKEFQPRYRVKVVLNQPTIDKLRFYRLILDDEHTTRIFLRTHSLGEQLSQAVIIKISQIELQNGYEIIPHINVD